MKECKNCGTTYDDSVKFCGQCGCGLADVEGVVKNEQDHLGDELVKPEEDALRPTEMGDDVTADVDVPEASSLQKSAPEVEQDPEVKQPVTTNKDTPASEQKKSNGGIWIALTTFFALGFFSLLGYHLYEINRVQDDYFSLRKDLRDSRQKLKKLEEQVRLEKEAVAKARAEAEQAVKHEKAVESFYEFKEHYQEHPEDFTTEQLPNGTVTLTERTK